jgi:hypothetical protein
MNKIISERKNFYRVNERKKIKSVIGKSEPLAKRLQSVQCGKVGFTAGKKNGPARPARLIAGLLA